MRIIYRQTGKLRGSFSPPHNNEPRSIGQPTELDLVSCQEQRQPIMIEVTISSLALVFLDF
jgi:hypothetical protein